MSDLLHRMISGYHLAVRTLRHEVIDATPTQWRLAADTVARLYVPPKDLSITTADWFGLRTDRISRASTDPTASPIIWIHGGAFAFCSPRTHRAAAAALSEATGRSVWLPDYPLAPEHPYPAALDALSHIHSDQPMDIVGDSAGGNLALAWALRRGRGDRLALLSPWVDLRVDSASSRHGTTSSSAFDREDLREYAAMYLRGHAATSSDCSPILAERSALERLGPVYLESAANELLKPDADMLSRQLKRAGIPTTEREEPHAHHGWQLFPDILPEARRSIAGMTDFLTQALPINNQGVKSD